MSGDKDPNTHPARKVNPEELKQLVAEKNETVPAVTRRMMAPEFPDAEPVTVGQNLDDLASSGELCRFNDGDVKLWWYPREDDETGSIPYEEFVDDSIDYSEIEPEDVPRELAEEIAFEKLPYYDPGSLWRDIARATHLGFILALGLVILGLSGVVAGSLGLSQSLATSVFQLGIVVALSTTVIYTAATFLDILASQDYVDRDPFPKVRQIFK